MIKTSPRMMIGFGNENGNPESPQKTISDANYSMDGPEAMQRRSMHQA